MSDSLADDEKEFPTVGHSDAVDEGARLLFEQWLPLVWRKRRQVPDIHVDYVVETVEAGEPTGLQFRVQVKGRSIHKRKAKKLAEPFKTKQLRYYWRCTEPVFVFLIDPTTKRGNWLFVQKYLKELPKGMPSNQKKLTLYFDEQCSLENQALFEQTLHESWRYMRDLFPGSPIAAILAQKKHLEQLCSGATVSISATDEFLNAQVSMKMPELKLPKAAGIDAIQAFFEKGQSFQVKASDIQPDELPFPSSILQELGDAKITIKSGLRFTGAIQLLLPRSTSPPLCLQCDGEWVIAPKRLSFTGALPDSPLKVQFMRVPNDGGNWMSEPLGINFDWSLWAEQPLLGVAYFHGIEEFLASNDCIIRAYIRGNQEGLTESVSFDRTAKLPAIEAVEWLKKCRQVAVQFGANPPMPTKASFTDVRSDHVQLIVKLLENGHHEQPCVGETTVIEADVSPGTPLPKHAREMRTPEPFRFLKFFGLKVPFGPLMHHWTDMQLVGTRPVAGRVNRVALTWKGGPNSTYRIEYHGPRLNDAEKKSR